MKQILQNLGNGETILAEVPCPRRGRGKLLIETTSSLVSLGTEKMLIDFGKGGWISKARSQPDKVKQVLQKIKTDGLWTTLDAVKAKLDTPIPLGYCNVGRVVESDEQSSFQVGDRVISNGPHAEMVVVPENLAARVPDQVDDQSAAFTVVGAIGLQGIRLLNPTLGERVVVSGLGLIGLLTVQMLKANGCEVLGIDFDRGKLELARAMGAATVDLSAEEDPVRAALNWTQGVGVDGVIITASTKSDELIHQCATMCRKRGRIVLVGVVGLNLQRADFYEKELSFQVSCSYGPGRYETNYESKGLDYPIGFVRWTEQRNFEAVLNLMAAGQVQTTSLVTHEFSFDQALEGYQAINQPGALGIVLNYAADTERKRQPLVSESNASVAPISGQLGVSFIGAGGFTTRMLLPLMPSGIERRTIVSGTGVSAAHAAKKFGFANVGSDYQQVLQDDQTDAVFITTPHSTHAKMVCEALQAGKHVFVEKPLAMNQQELDQVAEALENHPNQRLLVGFNRRFSPHTIAVKDWLKSRPGPKSIIITINAGAIPADHWTQDPEIGGGRIIGEGCHFIDLARFLADSPIDQVQAMPVKSGDGQLGDCVAIQLGFADGSIGTVHYLANGSKDFPKERIEVFAGGRVHVIDNFRRSFVYGGSSKLKTRSQDKGHANELKQFVASLKDGTPSPIPPAELLEISQATLTANRQVLEQLNG